MGKRKRDVEIVVLSDVHLGTYGCHAEELLRYLRSIRPRKIILNGDIIDIWQFSKNYWPTSHMQVIKYFTSLLAKSTRIIYIPGNHDEVLRKFSGFRLGSFSISNKALLNLNGKKAWIFHGDVFDVTMRHSKWLAKLGAIGYDSLILINACVNWCLQRMGYEKISLSKRVKDKVKGAIAFINDFEKTAAEIAIENKYEYVVCGHIHQPQIRNVVSKNGETLYLNSGDWVENLTALEFDGREWAIYRYHEDKVAQKMKIPDISASKLDTDLIFKDLVNQFLTVKA